MSDRLPRDREKALEAIATGAYTGRKASLAHPLCECGSKRPPQPAHPHIADVGDEDAYRLAWNAWVEAFRAWKQRRCPLH